MILIYIVLGLVAIVYLWVAVGFYNLLAGSFWEHHWKFAPALLAVFWPVVFLYLWLSN